MNPGTQTNLVGTLINLQISDPNADASSFTATGLPSGLGISNSGLITGTITGSAQSYSTTVSDTENGTTESVTFTWNVNAVALVNPGTQTNPVGASINLQISDPNADANSYRPAAYPAAWASALRA